MISLLRRIKLVYMVYNFFQWKRLKHNVAYYKKLGLNKRYYSPVSSLDFEGVDPKPLMQVQHIPLPANLQAEHSKAIKTFDEKGYAILPGYIDETIVEKINAEIDMLLTKGEVGFKYGNKIMFAYQKSDLLLQVGTNPQLLSILGYLQQQTPVLFQSINFWKGSQQATHSDSIHMTTFPQGGLIAVWLALEDTTPENGPLHYYAGSHKLPYYMNKDYGNAGNRWLIGPKDYSEYEEMMRNVIAEKKLTKETFLAKKGDILIWHANLFHGGEKQTNPNATRKSMVFHYFNQNTICYHEISQRPALMFV